MKRLSVCAVACILVCAPLSAGAASFPDARAWVLRIMVPATGEVLTIADASAASVTSATPVSVLSHPMGGVVATPETPDVKMTLQDYEDPTGSLSLHGGFAEAHTADTSRSARAGLDSITGSGFALANKYFTFEQQAQLLKQFKDLNDQIFDPLNQALGSVKPLLSPLGLSLPMLNGLDPIGLVDVVGAQQVAATADASSSPGFSSAHADAAAASVKLFGGFIEIDDVRATAVSESVAGADTRTASAKVGRVLIAGVEVRVDENGVHLAGNDLPLLQPVLDTALGALGTAGVSLRVVRGIADGDRRIASVLEVSAPGLLFSIGHAEASAATAAPIAAASVPPAASARPATHVLGVKYLAVPPAPIVAPPIVDTVTSGRRRVPLGGAAARAIRMFYLMMVVAATGGAIGYPLWIAGARRRETATKEAFES